MKRGKRIPSRQMEFLLLTFKEVRDFCKTTLTDIRDARLADEELQTYMARKWPRETNESHEFKLRNILRGYRDRMNRKENV